MYPEIERLSTPQKKRVHIFNDITIYCNAPKSRNLKTNPDFEESIPGFENKLFMGRSNVLHILKNIYVSSLSLFRTETFTYYSISLIYVYE